MCKQPNYQYLTITLITDESFDFSVWKKENVKVLKNTHTHTTLQGILFSMCWMETQQWWWKNEMRVCVCLVTIWPERHITIFRFQLDIVPVDNVLSGFKCWNQRMSDSSRFLQRHLIGSCSLEMNHNTLPKSNAINSIQLNTLFSFTPEASLLPQK